MKVIYSGEPGNMYHLQELKNKKINTGRHPKENGEHIVNSLFVRRVYKMDQLEVLQKRKNLSNLSAYDAPIVN